MQLGTPNAAMTNPGDEALLVKFEIRSRPDPAATASEGRPMFKDVEYIDIRIPGSRDNVCRPASQRDIDRFPQHYAAFKARVGDHSAVEGTALSEWPGITRSMVDNLAFHNVVTVEQLAGMPDSNVGQFMGGNNLKQKAQEWLEVAKEGKASRELKAELAKRDEEIAELKDAVKALQAKPRKKKAPRKKRVSKKTTVKKE